MHRPRPRLSPFATCSLVLLLLSLCQPAQAFLYDTFGSGPGWPNRVDDYIDAVQWDATNNVPRAVPVVDNFTVLRYANQDATLYGVDFSAMSRIASSDSLGVFSAGLVGSYTRGENDDTDDNLYNIMPLHATLALTQALGAWHNSLEGEFVAAKDDVSEVRNEQSTAGYGLMHLRSRYERDRWSMELGA